MNENNVNEAIEMGGATAENTVGVETLTEAAAETAVADGVVAAEGAVPAQGAIFEQVNDGAAETQEKPSKPKKKKASAQDVFTFVQTKIFTPKISKIVLLSLSILITVLCALQMVVWGFALKDDYKMYWLCIKNKDWVNIVLISIALLFMLILLTNIIKSIACVARGNCILRFSMITTFITFYCFMLFLKKAFGSRCVLVETFTSSVIFGFILALVIVYASVRIFGKDFRERALAVAISAGALLVVLFMYLQDMGNFATVTIAGDVSTQFSLSDLRLYNYFNVIKALAGEGEYTSMQGGYLEYIYLQVGAQMEIDGSLNVGFVVVLLQLIQIMASNLLPFAAISLIGYLLYGLADNNYMQYRNLEACKKVATSMLVVSIFSFISTFVLEFLLKDNMQYAVLEIDYTNVLVTMILCIVMMILTCLPWKIYSNAYKRQFNNYQESEAGV